MATDSDSIDQAAELAERERAALLSALPPFCLAAGKPGECDLCGEWFGRLVDGVCVPCRNRYEQQSKQLRKS